MMASQTLYRSKSDRVIAGVCAGIAQRLGTSPFLIRLLFLIFSHVCSTVYILMWIIVPANPTQKPGKTSILLKIVLGIVLVWLAFGTIAILDGYLR